MLKEELARVCGAAPYNRLLGLAIQDLDMEAETLVISMECTQHLSRAPEGDLVHGGAILGLIDNTAALLVIALTRAPVPTINLYTDFLRPAGEGILLARARVLKRGKMIFVVDVAVTDSSEKLIAVGRGSFGAKLV